jgi:hypothetical protein
VFRKHHSTTEETSESTDSLQKWEPLGHSHGADEGNQNAEFFACRIPRLMRQTHATMQESRDGAGAFQSGCSTAMWEVGAHDRAGDGARDAGFYLFGVSLRTSRYDVSNAGLPSGSAKIDQQVFMLVLRIDQRIRKRTEILRPYLRRRCARRAYRSSRD